MRELLPPTVADYAKSGSTQFGGNVVEFKIPQTPRHSTDNDIPPGTKLEVAGVSYNYTDEFHLREEQTKRMPSSDYEIIGSQTLRLLNHCQTEQADIHSQYSDNRYGSSNQTAKAFRAPLLKPGILSRWLKFLSIDHNIPN